MSDLFSDDDTDSESGKQRRSANWKKPAKRQKQATAASFETLLAQREAVPWTEERSVDRVVASLVAIRDIESLYESIGRGADFRLDKQNDTDDEEDDDDVVVVVRAEAMFCAKLVVPLLACPANAVVRDQFLARISPPLAERFTETAVDVNQAHWSTCFTRQVPRDWYTGQIKVAKSTDLGQCLFSSAALPLYGRGDDEVALWLRARCVFELLEQWQLYCGWFGEETARDMLDSLVGENPNSQRYGCKWPVAEVIWLLSSVLRRRIVVVRKLSRKTADLVGGALPFVVLPARHRVEEWGDAAPLVLLHLDAIHYKPLVASWIDAALRTLPFSGDLLTPALRDALAPFVDVYCTKPALSFPLK